MKRWSLAILLAAAACSPKNAPPTREENLPMKMSDEDWKKRLTREQYNITREKGTERPFSGTYNDFFGDGLYRCICCQAPLFASKTKYKSSCGWPSFWDAISKESVKFDALGGADGSEVMCAKCGSHLGHVFDDGPPPTGKRY